MLLLHLTMEAQNEFLQVSSFVLQLHLSLAKYYFYCLSLALSWAVSAK